MPTKVAENTTWAWDQGGGYFSIMSSSMPLDYFKMSANLSKEQIFLQQNITTRIQQAGCLKGSKLSALGIEMLKMFYSSVDKIRPLLVRCHMRLVDGGCRTISSVLTWRGCFFFLPRNDSVQWWLGPNGAWSVTTTTLTLPWGPLAPLASLQTLCVHSERNSLHHPIPWIPSNSDIGFCAFGRGCTVKTGRLIMEGCGVVLCKYIIFFAASFNRKPKNCLFQKDSLSFVSQLKGYVLFTHCIVGWKEVKLTYTCPLLSVTFSSFEACNQRPDGLFFPSQPKNFIFLYKFLHVIVQKCMSRYPQRITG